MFLGFLSKNRPLNNLYLKMDDNKYACSCTYTTLQTYLKAAVAVIETSVNASCFWWV